MSNKSTIRILNEKDVNESKKIRLEGLKNSPTNFGSSFEEESLFTNDIWESRLSNKNAITFGAFIDIKLVGVITLILNTRIKTKHTAEIHAMYVSELHQNEGIGYKLINELLNYSKENTNIELLMLSVEKENIHAINLYKKTGFIEFADFPLALKIDDKYHNFIMMNRVIK